MTRLPAEWEAQSAVLIAWPHASGAFSDHLASVEQTYSIIAETISEYQNLIIVCRDTEHRAHIQRQLGNGKRIFFVSAVVDDIWVRDTAFLTIDKEQELTLLNFCFNGWGRKYAFMSDNALNHALLNAELFHGHSYADLDYILEGGSIESDGKGTILTTRQCLLNPNRNSGLTQKAIERRLAEYFGAVRVLWLDQKNLAGDDTDAHIDTLARFCSVDTIAYTSCKNPDDLHYASLKNMQNQLEELRTLDGDPYHLVPLPMPEPIYNEDGQRLPANYANFLIINQAVLVPIYDDAMDALALERIANCFPERKVIAIPCRPLVHQYGSLHCMTMQFPVGVVHC